VTVKPDRKEDADTIALATARTALSRTAANPDAEATAVAIARCMLNAADEIDAEASIPAIARATPNDDGKNVDTEAVTVVIARPALSDDRKFDTEAIAVVIARCIFSDDGRSEVADTNVVMKIRCIPNDTENELTEVSIPASATIVPCKLSAADSPLTEANEAAIVRCTLNPRDATDDAAASTPAIARCRASVPSDVDAETIAAAIPRRIPNSGDNELAEAITVPIARCALSAAENPDAELIAAPIARLTLNNGENPLTDAATLASARAANKLRLIPETEPQVDASATPAFDLNATIMLAQEADAELVTEHDTLPAVLCARSIRFAWQAPVAFVPPPLPDADSLRSRVNPLVGELVAVVVFLTNPKMTSSLFAVVVIVAELPPVPAVAVVVPTSTLSV
jgi:hypothetical protein